MNVIFDQTTQRVPIYSWAEFIEEGALDQARHIAALPMAEKHVALMPDVHQGYGMPIGGVLALDGAVIPNAVGVDIGCGMAACSTSLHDVPRDTLKAMLGAIRRAVPVGSAHHGAPQDFALEPSGPVTEREATHARTQVGTLGGGNHFIEIQRAESGATWIMIHSGSRNVGLQVARHYNDLAVSLNARWRSAVPKAWELAFLPLNSDDAHAYLAEMLTCVAFARENRARMMAAIQGCVTDVCPGAVFGPVFDVAHNYAAMEHHFSRNLMVHRKGATSARAGELGIIPGSQGTASYIVNGLGAPESFTSCSHGAGRRMGRKEAQRTLSLKDETRRLEAQGVLHSIRGTGGLDEAPGAYKDIEEVMRQQADLVAIEQRLTPLGVIKG